MCQSLPTGSKYAPRDGTYSQEEHAVHGEGGVAGVEGKPARKRNDNVRILLSPEDSGRLTPLQGPWVRWTGDFGGGAG